MTEERVQNVFAGLEQELPPIVFRNWKDWKKYLPVSPRYVANLDSLGTGPDEKVMIGGVTGYPRESIIRFLKDRAKPVQRTGVRNG